MRSFLHRPDPQRPSNTPFSLANQNLNARTKRAQVAVYSNVRTTIGAQRAGWAPSFNVAFRAGSVMGFALTGMAILVLYVALWGYRQYFGDDVRRRSPWDRGGVV